MNKRKLITLALALCMVAILAIGGTLAYFTDSDADINVMTAGNVQIVQNETDREGEAYVDGQKLYPAVYLDEDGKPYNPATGWEGPVAEKATVEGPDGNDMQLWTEGIENEIDKIVSVTNGGTEDAYVRTIVLMENAKDEDTGKELTDKLHVVYSDETVAARKWINEITVNGQLYEAYVFTYKNAVKAGETSPASLKQVWLDPTTDNGWYDMLVDDVFEIIVFSQAVQTTGFEDAETALATAFGEVNDANVEQWLATTPIKPTGLNNKVGGR